MAAVVLRRSLATLTIAGLAVAGSPLVENAFAAAALTAPTWSPASPAKANRPTFRATYNVALAGSSTIALIDTSSSNAAVSCPGSVGGAAISCTPTDSLIDGHVYKATVHAVNADGSGNARDDSSSWTIDIPSLTSSSPANGDAVAGSGSVTATYDEAIDTSASTITVRNINNNTAAGGTSFSASSFAGPTDTITFSPSQSLPPGSYVATIHAQANGNSASWADTVINYTINNTMPTAPPTVSTAGFSRDGATHYINSLNQKSVPFAGTAQPGFRVGVLVYDKNTPKPSLPSPIIGQGQNDRLVTTAVAPCGSTMCPWQLSVDTTNTPDTAYQYYVYVYSAAGQLPGSLNSNTDPTITKDTAAPAAGQAATGSISGNTLTVGDGNDPDTSVAFWNVVVTDTLGGKVGKENILAGAGPSHGFSTTIDVSPLVDGDLTIDTYASDAAGNLSQSDEPSPFNAPGPKETVALAIDTAHSFVTVNGTNLGFGQVAGHRIALPSSITLKFNEPIRSAVMDSSGSHSGSPVSIFSAGMCLADSTGLCVAAKSIALTSDQQGLVLTPLGGGSAPQPGNYSLIRVTAPAATTGSCPDKSNFNSSGYSISNCERVDTAAGHNGTDPVLTFNIDDVAPTPAFTGFTPSVVTGATVNQVNVTGTTDADTASVQLLIKSSGGGSPKVVNVPVTAPTDPNATTVGWSTGPIDLSTVPDGTLTVSATATDQAGNTTATPVVLSPSPVLAAHLSWLTENTSNRAVTFGRLIRLSGRLVDNSGVGIANAPVSIRPRFDSGAYGAAMTATTDTNGYWSRFVSPSRNATYWATYAGSNTTGALHDPVTVHGARTLVRVRIGWKSPRNGSRVGAPVVLKGFVSPNKHGKYVYFYKHTKRRNILLGRARLGRGSAWVFRVTLPRGTTLVFARIGNTPGNVGNHTGYLKLRR